MNVEPDRFFSPNSPKRSVNQPPGGRCSDIFGSSGSVPASPRRVNNHMKSNIFDVSPPAASGQQSPQTHKRSDSTTDRLFGNSPTGSPRLARHTDTTRSTVFDVALPKDIANGHSTSPAKQPPGGRCHDIF